ncbi:DUF421 domain-containing protein [Thalassobacillus pellis]|uniref:DUF421 domain-containing protein n=1 Tax=Thalassobacillus pellis TaxID=748008 RepID=UPI00195FDC9D|nr:DUF421 domain-containing protein [Thalassobacillus pellis]MBM7553999.1 uncharacterized membrane protein YcaP (DUF421 family) [Thalassobacillus pellis]
MDYLRILAETIFGFGALFVLTKVLGKSQITQITAFDFIAAMILGELVGNALYDPEVGIVQIGYAVLVWGILLYVTEMVTEKVKKSRSLLEGKPSIVINKGKILKQEMLKSKLDLNQLQHLLRSKEVFSIQDVEFAILETDGTISVLKKSTAQTPTRQDLNLKPQTVPLPMALISDGEVLWDNLKEAGLNKQWLHDQLRRQNVTAFSDVFFAEYKEGEDLYVLPY